MDLAAAEGWYRKLLEVKEALGNRPVMAMTYGQLGLLAETRKALVAALDWTVRCIALARRDTIGEPMAATAANFDRQSLRGFIAMVEADHPDELLRMPPASASRRRSCRTRFASAASAPSPAKSWMTPPGTRS